MRFLLGFCGRFSPQFRVLSRYRRSGRNLKARECWVEETPWKGGISSRGEVGMLPPKINPTSCMGRDKWGCSADSARNSLTKANRTQYNKDRLVFAASRNNVSVICIHSDQGLFTCLKKGSVYRAKLQRFAAEGGGAFRT